MFDLLWSSHLKPDEVLAKLKKASMQRLKVCGYLVEAQAKRLLSDGKSTKTKQLNPKTGKKETKTTREPSPPGKPPHILTGNLRSSIRTAPDGEVVVVGPTTTAWYGRIHEFGGKHHPARPFMRPALSQCAEKFPQQFYMLDFG